jgi:hypothetical protein
MQTVMHEIEQDLTAPEQYCNASEYLRESVHGHRGDRCIELGMPYRGGWLFRGERSHYLERLTQRALWYSDRPDHARF